MNTSTDSPYTSTTTNPGQNLPITPVIMLFLFGAAGNILAMVVLIYSSKKHKWRTFYRLVGALAVSDFIGILGPLPISLAAYSNNKKWIGGQLVCDLMSFFFIFAGLASASLAGAMSLDRFLAIKKPHFYSRYATKRRVNVMMAILWLSAFIVACMPIMGLNENIRQYPGTWCFFNFVATEVKDKFYSFLFASLGTSVIALMIVLNTLVTFELGKRCIQARKNKSSREHNDQISNRSINDVYNMIFLIVLMTVFSICWIPLMFIVMVCACSSRTQADFLGAASPEQYATDTEHSMPLSHIILTLSTPVLPLTIFAKSQAGGQKTTNFAVLVYELSTVNVAHTLWLLAWLKNNIVNTEFIRVRVFINQFNLKGEPETDLLALRLAITNQIMDPWIYILLRKDFLAIVLKFVKRHVIFCPCTIADEHNRADRSCSFVPNQSELIQNNGVL